MYFSGFHFLLCILLTWSVIGQNDFEAPRLQLNDYLLMESVVRNVLFVGKSRSGKTTTVQVLKDKSYIAPDESIFAGTLQPELQSFSIHRGGKYFNVNILDTPGLFERGRNMNETRDSEVLLGIITKVVDLEISRLHKIYFVIHVSAGLDQHDIESLLLFKKQFEGANNLIRMVFTRAESFSERRQANLKEQLKEVPELAPLADTMLFIGAIPEDKRDQLTERERRNIVSMREKLLDDIFDGEASCNVRELDMYRKRLSVIRQVKQYLEQKEDFPQTLLAELNLLLGNLEESVCPLGGCV